MDPPKQVFTTPAAVKAAKERALKDRSQEKEKKGGNPKGGKDRNESVDLTEDEEETETAEEKRERETMEREMLAKQGSTKLFKTPPTARSTSVSSAPPTPAEKHKRSKSSPEADLTKKPRREEALAPQRGETSDSEMSVGKGNAIDWENNEIDQSASDLQKECWGLCNAIFKLTDKYKMSDGERKRLAKRMIAVKNEVTKMEDDLAETMGMVQDNPVLQFLGLEGTALAQAREYDLVEKMAALESYRIRILEGGVTPVTQMLKQTMDSEGLIEEGHSKDGKAPPHERREGGKDVNTELDRLGEHTESLANLLSEIADKTNKSQTIDTDTKSMVGRAVTLVGVVDKLVRKLDRKKIPKDSELKAAELKQKADQIRSKIDNEPRNYANFLELMELRWPERVFERVKTSKEEIMELSREWDLAQLTTGDFRSEGTTEKQFKVRYQGIEELLAQETEPGGVAFLTEEVSIPAKTGKVVKTKRYVYNLIAAPGHKDSFNLEDMYNCGQSLRALMSRAEREQVAIADDRIKRDVLRKLLEYTFAGTETKVLLVKTQVDVEKGPRERRPEASRRKAVGIPRDEALVIKVNQGSSYADLLRDVRTKVDLDKTGATLSSIRKTRDGDLLLAVRKKKEGGNHIDDLSREIKDKVNGVEMRKLKAKELIIHINGMDEATTEEEVLAAVKGALPPDAEGVAVKAMWPARGHLQNAAVEIPREKARVLLEHGRVKIGWSICRLRERVDVAKCFRCWGTGHVRANCNGVDRSALCHRCGQEGHTAKDCKNNMYCPVCSKEGHKACGTGCPEFRRALEAHGPEDRGS